MDTPRIPPAGDPFTALPKPRTAECVGCRQRFPRRELLIVQDDRHDNVVFFEGDKVCRPCARRNGVSY
jgi:hypothetical protein